MILKYLKKHKPHIYKNTIYCDIGNWVCETEDYKGSGDTPLMAHSKWLSNKDSNKLSSGMHKRMKHEILSTRAAAMNRLRR